MKKLIHTWSSSYFEWDYLAWKAKRFVAELNIDDEKIKDEFQTINNTCAGCSVGIT